MQSLHSLPPVAQHAAFSNILYSLEYRYPFVWSLPTAPSLLPLCLDFPLTVYSLLQVPLLRCLVPFLELLSAQSGLGSSTEPDSAGFEYASSWTCCLLALNSLVTSLLCSSSLYNYSFLRDVVSCCIQSLNRLLCQWLSLHFLSFCFWLCFRGLFHLGLRLLFCRGRWRRRRRCLLFWWLRLYFFFLWLLRWLWLWFFLWRRWRRRSSLIFFFFFLLRLFHLWSCLFGLLIFLWSFFLLKSASASSHKGIASSLSN